MENFENTNEAAKEKGEEVVVEGAEGADAETTAQEEHHHSRHSHHSHHRHHHSHHSSHHRRHSRKRKTQSEKIKISHKAGWALVIALCILFSAAAYTVGRLEANRTIRLEQQAGEQSSDILKVSIENNKYCLVSDAVNKYLSLDISDSENADITPKFFTDKGERVDRQIPVVLKFSLAGGHAGLYKIDLATDSTFSDCKTAYVEETPGKYELRHLLANTTYYYRVTAYMKGNTEAVTGKFKTADTPRILSVEGLYNVRDLGNQKTESGHRIKQGLLIRGTEMDGAVEEAYHITNKGVVVMLEELNIKTDMDLRAKTTDSKDALGAGVKHNYYGVVMYDDVFTVKGKETVRKVFADLANESNYPIYLHCTHGCDRTGIICYLLESVLGVSKDDCLKEYGLSNLTLGSIKKVEKGLASYEGKTHKDRAEAYLLSCGVTKQQISSIRNIFLGE